MGNLAKDTTEMDLWAFDDVDPLDENPAIGTPKTSKPGIPVPRDTVDAAGDEDSGRVLQRAPDWY